MRSQTKSPISAADVQAEASRPIQQHLKFADFSRKCPWSVIMAVLLFAASRRRSIHDACRRLSRTPSDETLRQALHQTLPDVSELERRIGVKVHFLLLGKGFFHVEVIRCLQAARC